MAPFPSPTSTWHSDTYDSLSPTRPELSAKAKNVLITGGGTGIGAETAKYFAEAGASRIAILGRRQQPLLDTKHSIEKEFPNVEIVPIPTDVMQQAEVDAAFAQFLPTGRLDVLVSGAAMTGPLGSVEAVDSAAFLLGVQQNLAGSLYVAKAFLRHAAADAVVIEISSSAAHLNFGPGFASYSVAKMAVVRLWDSLAYANPHLRVFHVQPGVVATDMNKAAGGVEATGFSDDVSLPASFNVWLASPEASFLKGKFLWANWDVEELKSRAGEIENSERFNIGLVGWPFGEPGWTFQSVANDATAKGVWSS